MNSRAAADTFLGPLSEQRNSLADLLQLRRMEFGTIRVLSRRRKHQTMAAIPWAAQSLGSVCSGVLPTTPTTQAASQSLTRWRDVSAVRW